MVVRGTPRGRRAGRAGGPSVNGNRGAKFTSATVLAGCSFTTVPGFVAALFVRQAVPPATSNFESRTLELTSTEPVPLDDRSDCLAVLLFNYGPDAIEIKGTIAGHVGRLEPRDGNFFPGSETLSVRVVEDAPS